MHTNFCPLGFQAANLLRSSMLIVYSLAQSLHSTHQNALRIACRRPSGPLNVKYPGPTMRIDRRMLDSLARILIIGATGLVFGDAPTRAQSYLSGTYNCVSIEVGGKTHPCKAPSLEMNSDGSYQILAERGTYEILKGHWLILSAAKNHGRARLDGSKEIIFEFVSGGQKSKITYRRKYQRPPAWVSS
jgi:hypothetical protein